MTAEKFVPQASLSTEYSLHADVLYLFIPCQLIQRHLILFIEKWQNWGFFNIF